MAHYTFPPMRTWASSCFNFSAFITAVCKNRLQPYVSNLYNKINTTIITARMYTIQWHTMAY